MNARQMAAMAEATRLTRQGRLIEAKPVMTRHNFHFGPRITPDKLCSDIPALPAPKPLADIF